MFFKVKMEIARWLFVSAFLILLISCGNTPPTIQPTESPRITLTQFFNPTASATSPDRTAIVVTPTNLPTPTPTPIMYTIVEGDTMLAIALRNGISLEELQGANPEVNPRLLSVGTELIIPLGDIVPVSPMTATPVPINIASTDCYVVSDGIWCFLLVKNDLSRELENLSARVVLYDIDGDIVGEGVAIGALNKLPVDGEIPLVIFIPSSYTGEFTIHTTVLSVQRVPRNDDRYLNAWLEVDETEMSEKGLQTSIKGTYGIPSKSIPGNITWIVGTAYDVEGNVVGVRKIEHFGLIEPGSSHEFTLEIFSVGPRISEVNTMVEIRP
jgi:LysM repeat protein